MNYPNNSEFDSFDALIKLSCSTCMDTEADEFLSAPIDYPVDVKAKRKNYRRIQKLTKLTQKTKHPTARKTLRVIAIAAALLLSLAFVACMSIPKVREAIWEAVVEVYEDYISIDFVEPISESNADLTFPAGTTVSTSTTKSTVTPRPEPPKSIIETNAPTFVPDGYEMFENETDKIYTIDYFSLNSDDMFNFTQSIIQGSYYKGNSEEGSVSEISLNGLPAILIIYNDSNEYGLYWQDNLYQYSLYGIFDSYEQLVAIASSVSIK